MSLIIFLNVVFTAVTFYVFVKVGSEPTALVGTWFAFTTGELWLLATIKKKKMKDGEEMECEDDEDCEDEEGE